MSRNEFLILVALSASVAVAFAAMSDGDDVAPTSASLAVEVDVRRGDAAREQRAVERHAGAAALPAPATMRVTLELERSAALDAVGDVRLGAERGARLVGQLVGVRGEPVVGVARFVAGPNRGRRLLTDRAGRFSAGALVPGCGLVEIEGAGGYVARREVCLRPSEETRLHLTWAGARSLAGYVCDDGGVGIPAASVFVDGRAVRTGEDGRFLVADLPTGVVSLDVVADGYASARRRVRVGAADADDQEVRVSLAPEARLELCPPSGMSSSSRVWLLPASAAAAPATPWERYGGIALTGEPLRLRGLPAGPVHLYVHRVDQADEAATRLELREGVERRFELPPATGAAGAPLRGVVVRGGAPVAGASVECWAPAPRSASAARMRLPASAFDVAPLPLLPPAYERVEVGADGAFLLSPGHAPDGWRQLRVLVDAVVVVDRPLWPSDLPAHVDVTAMERLQGSVAFDVPACRGTRTVELVRGGAPCQVTTLPPGAPFVVEGLPCGHWSVRVSSGPIDLVPASAVQVSPNCQQRVIVPE